MLDRPTRRCSRRRFAARLIAIRQPIQIMQIRDATPADRDAIIAVDHLAASDRGRRIQFIDRVLRSATCLVTEREGEVIAYAALEYTFFDNGFVSMVYVAEPERRRGVGRALMEACAASGSQQGS